MFIFTWCWRYSSSYLATLVPTENLQAGQVSRMYILCHGLSFGVTFMRTSSDNFTASVDLFIYYTYYKHRARKSSSKVQRKCDKTTCPGFLQRIWTNFNETGFSLNRVKVVHNLSWHVISVTTSTSHWLYLIFITWIICSSGCFFLTPLRVLPKAPSSYLATQTLWVARCKYEWYDIFMHTYKILLLSQYALVSIWPQAGRARGSLCYGSAAWKPHQPGLSNFRHRILWFTSQWLMSFPEAGVENKQAPVQRVVNVSYHLIVMLWT